MRNKKLLEEMLKVVYRDYPGISRKKAMNILTGKLDEIRDELSEEEQENEIDDFISEFIPNITADRKKTLREMMIRMSNNHRSLTIIVTFTVTIALLSFIFIYYILNNQPHDTTSKMLVFAGVTIMALTYFLFIKVRSRGLKNKLKSVLENEKRKSNEP